MNRVGTRRNSNKDKFPLPYSMNGSFSLNDTFGRFSEFSIANEVAIENYGQNQ